MPYASLRHIPFSVLAEDQFLGFFNRTCGSLPPRTVGPALRLESEAQTWRKWVITIIGGNEKEQWGYIETYYPETMGKARCVSCVSVGAVCM